MTAAYIGLGSNMEDPRGQVQTAMDELDALPQSRLTGRSSLYRSAPLGPQDQPDFINAVAKLETRLEPADLLARIQGIEQRHGRRRDRRWGPRTLDLDLLLYGDMTIDQPGLTVPHPGIAARNFVLRPLIEIDPAVVIPGRGLARDLLASLAPADAGRLEAL